VAIYFVDSFLLKYIILGVATAFDSNMNSANFSLIRELTIEGSKYNSIAVNIGFVFYSFGSVFIGLITLYITTANTLWITIAASFFISFTGNLFFYSESPILNYKKKKQDAMIASMLTVSAGNGVKTNKEELLKEIYQLELKAELSEGDQQTNFSENDQDNLSKSLLDTEPTQASPNMDPISPMGANDPNKVIHVEEAEVATPPPNASFAKMAAILSVEAMGIYLLFYGLAISIDSCGFDSIQVNAILLGVSSMFGYYYSGVLDYYPRIKTKTALFASVIITTLINYLIATYAPENLVTRIIRTILTMVVTNIILCGLFCNFYIYASEIFPVTLRGTGLGIAVFVGKLMGSSSSFVKSYCINNGLDPVIGFTLPSVLAIIALQFAPEIYPKKKTN